MRYLLCLLLLPTCAWSQELATVVLLRGQAQVGKSHQGLKLNDRIKAGDTITTGPQSFIRLKFDDGIALQAGPNGELKIEKAADQVTTVGLVRGELLSRIKPGLKKEDKYRVRTPEAVMGVRGTTFFTRVTADKKPTFLCVCEGHVRVTFQGHEHEVIAKHHDSPAYLGSKWEEATSANGIAHSDGDIQELDRLLGK